MERRVYRYETVGSTNTELMALARQGAAEGTVVLARQQTAGRGRMGRSFQSPAGLGLYGSVLLRSSPEDAPRIPALAATAVRRAIRRSCGLSCGIKWPNDLVLSDRKVCGILAEALPGPEGSLWVVVGIGINVCQRREDFLPELRETAASLSMIAGAEIDRAALETAFLEELEALRRELPQETAERRQEYGAACLNLGHRVRVLRPGGERAALAVSLTPDYGLAVRYDDGTEESSAAARYRCGACTDIRIRSECMRTLWSLFLTFAKVGVMTFGGGYAMLPILQREVVENKGWATDEELTDYFAIGQCTPGVIAVNTATFIGQKRAGIAGGIVATLGVVFPSLLIIVALAGVITSFSHLTWVQHAFAGIRVCVCVLIFNAVLKLWKSAVKDVWGLLIFLAVLAASLLTTLSPVWYVLAAGVAGVLIQNLRGAKK